MFGHLGLSRAPKARDWFFVMDLLPEGQMQIIVERIKADPRTGGLAGRFLNIGLGGGAYSPDSLARWWVWRANEVGQEQAWLDIDAYLDAKDVEALEHVWVFGLEVRKPVRLTETVSLIPWEAAPLSPLWTEVAQERFSVVPNHRHPVSVIAQSKMIVRDFQSHEMPLDHSLDYDSLVRLAFLLNAMPGICAVPGLRAFGLAANVPPGPFGGYSTGSFHLEIKPRGPDTTSTIPAELFRRLADRLAGLNKSELQKWDRTLRRLAQAKSRIDVADAALDLGVALEMVLLDGKVEQLSLAFRTRGAWLLGSTAEERAKIFETLKRLYNLRSEVAHTGRSKSLEKLNDLEARKILAEGFGLAERIVATLLLNGPPDWTLLTLGGTRDPAALPDGAERAP